MDRTLRLWTFIHSLCFLALGVYLLYLKMPGQAPWVVPAAAGIGVCSFTVLFLLQGRSSVSIPNAVSLLRLALAALAAVLLFFGGRGYVVFTLFALAGLTDFLDGLAARRLGTSPFGAKLDMELDALFIFLLAAAAYVYFGLDRLVLVAGLLRYGYVFLLPLLPDPGEMPAIVRLLSKGACALAETALIIVTAPVVGNDARGFLGLAAVCLLCGSFLLDGVLRLLLGRSMRYRSGTAQS